MDINPSYAHIRYPDGCELTVLQTIYQHAPLLQKPLSHMNNDITTSNQTLTQSSANYMNYETSENRMYLNQFQIMVLNLLILLLVMLLLCYVDLHV